MTMGKMRDTSMGLKCGGGVSRVSKVRVSRASVRVSVSKSN